MLTTTNNSACVRRCPVVTRSEKPTTTTRVHESTDSPPDSLRQTRSKQLYPCFDPLSDSGLAENPRTRTRKARRQTADLSAKIMPRGLTPSLAPDTRTSGVPRTDKQHGLRLASGPPRSSTVVCTNEWSRGSYSSPGIVAESRRPPVLPPACAQAASAGCPPARARRKTGPYHLTGQASQQLSLELLDFLAGERLPHLSRP
jgi:hypothetical protein